MAQRPAPFPPQPAFATSTIMRRLFMSLAIIVIGVLAIFAFGALRTPSIVRYRIALPGLTQPLRVVQLSDSHASWIDMPPSRLVRIVAQMNALDPDVIVLTGDYRGGKIINRPHMALTDALMPFAALRARLGVYAVPGNHDYAAATRVQFGREGIRQIDGDWIDIGPVILAGSGSFASRVNPIQAFFAAIAAAPPGKPMITLSHEPDMFQYVPRRSSVHISGHTHGGQIMLPLLGTRSLSGYLDAHLRGVFREHGQVMVVSSGLGTSLIPIRIGVPPEIVEITLLPDHSVGRKSGTDR